MNGRRNHLRCVTMTLRFSTCGLLPLGGCVSGSLATNTGPRTAGRYWCDTPRQAACVGETVEFDFVLQDIGRRFVHPAGLVDYCIAQVRDERVEVLADPVGRFRFAHTLDTQRPGDDVTIRAVAFRTRGRRDYMKVGDEWLSTESPYDIPDDKVAEDRLTLSMYVVDVSLSLARPPDDLEPDSGVLKIMRNDGTVTTRYIGRPNRPGFKIDGPGADGYYHVDFTPRGNEINPVGTTRVDFEIYDVAGNKHTATAVIETP